MTSLRPPRERDRSSERSRRPPPPRRLLALTLGTACSLGCQHGVEIAPAMQPAPPSAEELWLAAIGSGPAQTARACGQGVADRVAQALCTTPAPTLGGLEDLYRVLRLGPEDHRLVAVATHSLALSARIVSSANPRVFVLKDTLAPGESRGLDRFVTTAFVRGEQLVELVGLDPTTYEYNFYLLRFEQQCNRSRCTPEDLLSEKIERGWTSWTLYSDRDLEDTPLDCLSCHLPFGPGTHKQLLMRQIDDPWMHWSDFRGGTVRTLCPMYPSNDVIAATADGIDLLLQLERSTGHYAGVPLRELEEAKSGSLFATFVADAEQNVRLSPYRDDYPYEQLTFSTRQTLCERFQTGTSPYWDEQRRTSQDRGLPVPYYTPDVLDQSLRPELLADRTGLLRRHAAEDAVDVASSWLAHDVPAAVGFIPQPDDTAPEILRAMCVRCHAKGTDPRLRRSRFDVESLDRIEPAAFREIRRRLRLPMTSAEIMPPRRVGELPLWAIERIETYLRERCATPGACK